MDKDTLRLECLKLAVAKSVDFAEMMERAERFLIFVSEGASKLDNATPTSAELTAGTGLQPAGHTVKVGPKSS